jgi:hypothetical protein
LQSGANLGRIWVVLPSPIIYHDFCNFFRSTLHLIRLLDGLGGGSALTMRGIRTAIRLGFPKKLSLIVLLKSLSFGVCLLLVWCAKGATILNGSFDYTNGPLVIVSAGLWATHSGITGQVDVISRRVDLQVPESEDVNAHSIQGTLDRRYDHIFAACCSPTFRVARFSELICSTRCR